jgi:ADP-dependent NAD(P)H-hydrate dehydratase
MNYETTLPQIPRRRPDAHKGDFGTAMILGGSLGMAGAPALAGMAALRGGAGLVRLAVPDTVQATVAGFEPSYMTLPLLADANGRIAAMALPYILEQVKTASVIACGPGLGRSTDLDVIAAMLYKTVPQPMIFDADALNALAQTPEILRSPGGPRILTPHPGEFARLVGEKLEGTRREEAAVQLAAQCGVVVVLKGHQTLITDGTRHALNATGNPGMATGGSGDVLTGLITALVCQHLATFDAARLGVHLHGLAGDLAAEELGEISLIASDLVAWLPKAFLKIAAG